MSREEFIKTSVLLGYCDQRTAQDYTLEHPKAEYSEEDYENVYRKAERKYAYLEHKSQLFAYKNIRTRNSMAINTGVWRW